MVQLPHFDIPQYVVLIGFAGLGVYLLAMLINFPRRGSLTAWMFNARVDESVGVLHGGGPYRTKSRVTVYILERDSAERVVGVECVSRLWGGRNAYPLTLSSSQARELIAILERAVARL